MTKEERKKSAAWSIARDVFTSGEWIIEMGGHGERCVAFARKLVNVLDEHGCFDDAYGDAGSTEVDFARRMALKLGAVKVHLYDMEGDELNVSNIFDLVRDLHTAKALNDDEISRSVALRDDDIKREREEAAMVAAEDRKRKTAEEEKAANDKRMAEIERRLDEIKRERGEA